MSKDVDAFLAQLAQERPAAPPQAPFSLKELSPFLSDVNTLTARLSASTAKQLMREKKNRAGKLTGPAKTKCRLYKRKYNTEWNRKNAYKKLVRNRRWHASLKAKWNALVRYAKGREVMTYEEYMDLWLTKIPKIMQDGVLDFAHKAKAVKLLRIDASKGFTIDNLRAVLGHACKPGEEIWRLHPAQNERHFVEMAEPRSGEELNESTNTLSECE